MRRARAAWRRWLRQQWRYPSSRPPRAERARSMVGILEGVANAGSLLIGLVSFASEQNDIARLRLANRRRNRCRTIELHRITAIPCLANAVHHFAGDCRGFLAARVVASHNDAIGQPRGEATHFRPLAAVALTAAAEDADQFVAGADRWTQRSERLFQRIGRMGVVDDDQRLSVATEVLHASRRSLNVAQELQGFL